MYTLSGFPVKAAHCELPSALRPGLSQKGKMGTKEREQRKSKRKNERCWKCFSRRSVLRCRVLKVRTEETVKGKNKTKRARPLLLLRNSTNAGAGRNCGSSSPPVPRSPASTLRSFSRSVRSLRSRSDISLPASSAAGTSPPVSVVERRPTSARLRLPSARRPRVLNQLSSLSASFRTESSSSMAMTTVRFGRPDSVRRR